jgi:hypothetical protein
VIEKGVRELLGNRRIYCQSAGLACKRLAAHCVSWQRGEVVGQGPGPRVELYLCERCAQRWLANNESKGEGSS